MTTKTVLGWDVSSTTTAYAVLEFDTDTKIIKFIKSDYIKPIKKGNIIDRLANTRNQVKAIIEKVKPDYIGIEDILTFIPHRSTAQTVIILGIFNRMIGLVARDYLGRAPRLFSVMKMRHGLKLGKKPPKKEDMPALVAKLLGIPFPYELQTRGKNKGKQKVENYDKADSIAVALYYAFVLVGKTKAKGLKKLQKNSSALRRKLR